MFEVYISLKLAISSQRGSRNPGRLVCGLVVLTMVVCCPMGRLLKVDSLEQGVGMVKSRWPFPRENGSSTHHT